MTDTAKTYTAAEVYTGIRIAAREAAQAGLGDDDIREATERWAYAHATDMMMIGEVRDAVKDAIHMATVRPTTKEPLGILGRQVLAGYEFEKLDQDARATLADLALYANGAVGEKYLDTFWDNTNRESLEKIGAYLETLRAAFPEIADDHAYAVAYRVTEELLDGYSD